MHTQVTGTVVKKDRYEWEMNGKTGVSYSFLIRAEGSDESLAADKIKVTEAQFSAVDNGARLEKLPVLVTAQLGQAFDGSPVAKLVAKVPQDYAIRVLTGAGPKP